MKTKAICLVLALCLIVPAAFATGCGDSSPGGISFPAPNLEAAIREAIGKPSGEINQSDLEAITEFDTVSTFQHITNLTGLEYCINLEVLDLDNEEISDLSPIAGLTNLTVLNLSWNELSDISPISGWST